MQLQLNEKPTHAPSAHVQTASETYPVSLLEQLEAVYRDLQTYAIAMGFDQGNDQAE